MGVDFFPCYACKDTVVDCGPYTRCDGCGWRFCEDCHKGPAFSDEADEDEDAEACRLACPVCSLRVIGDWELRQFLLKTLGWTKQEAEEAYRTEVRRHGKH